MLLDLAFLYIDLCLFCVSACLLNMSNSFKMCLSVVVVATYYYALHLKLSCKVFPYHYERFHAIIIFHIITKLHVFITYVSFCFDHQEPNR